jgi:hypothetical protein
MWAQVFPTENVGYVRQAYTYEESLVSVQMLKRRLDPVNFSFLSVVEESYGIRCQSGSYSLINVEKRSHCLLEPLMKSNK